MRHLLEVVLATALVVAIGWGVGEVFPNVPPEVCTDLGGNPKKCAGTPARQVGAAKRAVKNTPTPTGTDIKRVGATIIVDTPDVRLYVIPTRDGWTVRGNRHAPTATQALGAALKLAGCPNKAASPLP